MSRPTDHSLHRAFTAVELLVVMAIIVLLVAILLPSMTRAREMGRRAVCASNQHQIHSLVIGLAADRFGQLPQTERNSTSSDHLTWINHDLHRAFQEYSGLKPYEFTGPSDTEFITARQMDIFYCANRRNWERNTGFGHRLGYFYMWGRGHNSPLPWSNDDPHRPWVESAQKLNDSPTWLFTSDIVEQGTHIPNVTSLTHAVHGSQMTTAGTVINPATLGGEGVNSCYLDGSVQWRFQNTLVEHPSSRNGTIRGWW